MMHKKIFKHKITAEIDAQLREVAKHLPTIQELNNDGTPKTFIRYESTAWEDLPPVLKVKTKKEFKIRRGKVTDEPVTYRIPFRIPATFNHYGELVKRYKTGGEAAVAEYVDGVNKITEASQKAAEAIEVPVQEAAVENGG